MIQPLDEYWRGYNAALADVLRETIAVERDAGEWIASVRRIFNLPEDEN